MPESNIYRIGLGICMLIVAGLVFRYFVNNQSNFINVFDQILNERIVKF